MSDFYPKISAKNRRILLASASPRRLSLLKQCGLEPVVVTSDIEEEIQQGESFLAYTRRLASQKVLQVTNRVVGSYPDIRFVVGADTVVVFQDQLLEKPRDAAQAVAMLSMMSGKRHEVITSFAIRDRCGVEGDVVVRSRQTEVYMRKLSPQTIENYVNTGDPMDKAGAYGIQSVGAALVDRVNGSFFAVVGLPVADVIDEMEKLGGLTDYPF